MRARIAEWLQAQWKTDMKTDMPSLSRLSSAFNSSSKTRPVRSGRSLAVWPGSNSEVISGHFGLHVNVMKKSGCPIFQHKARPLYVRSLMSPGDPVYDDGRAVFFTLAPV